MFMIVLYRVNMFSKLSRMHRWDDPATKRLAERLAVGAVVLRLGTFDDTQRGDPDFEKVITVDGKLGYVLS